jgi:hypothetical protein
MILLTTGNTKIEKTNATDLGYLTAILHLSPHNSSGHGNVCTDSTVGCRESCFRESGHFRWPSVIRAHDAKTEHFFENRKEFLKQLDSDLTQFEHTARAKGLLPAVRLNGTSDIAWERIAPDLFKRDVAFYDYTKSMNRMVRFIDGKGPKNLHLTFSRSESNEGDCKMVLVHKGQVAVVFRKLPFPKSYLMMQVIDGDDHDLTFLKPKNKVIGLVAKGKARRDKTGFVVDV